MRRFLISAVMLVSVVVTGCQTTPLPPSPPSAQWRWRTCTDRAFDAGLCEQPNNFNLFGWLIGDR